MGGNSAPRLCCSVAAVQTRSRCTRDEGSYPGCFSTTGQSGDAVSTVQTQM